MIQTDVVFVSKARTELPELKNSGLYFCICFLLFLEVLSVRELI